MIEHGLIETVRFAAIVLLLLGGLFFTFISAVGVIRLPDLYSRSHMGSETDTLGAGLTLAAVALALGWQAQTVLTVLLLVFIFITNPTAAHAIARAALEEGNVPYAVEQQYTDTTAHDTTGDSANTAYDYQVQGGEADGR